MEPQAEEPKGFQERLQSYCRMVKDLVVLGYQAIVGELRRVLSGIKKGLKGRERKKEEIKQWMKR